MAGANPLTAPVKPAHCAVAMQSPPDFSWPEQGRGVGYQIALTYPGGRRRTTETSRNWVTWDEQLPPGDYAWSVRLARGSGSVESAVRRFTVSPDAVPFIVPNWERLYQTAASMPHPRGFPRGEERAELMAALRGERKEAFARFLARVDRSLREPMPPEPGVRADSFAEDRERKAMMATIQQLSIAETRRIQETAFAWQITRRDDYLQDAKRRVLNLAAWDPAGATGMKSQDLAHRYIAWTLALSYDWLHEALDPGQRTAVLAAVVARQAPMIEEVIGERGRMAIAPYNSHGEVLLTSVAAISALVAGDAPQTQRWFADSVPLHLHSISPWGGDDGGYANGTSYAQWYLAEALLPWDVLRWSTGFDVRTKPWLRNLGRYLTYFLPPGTPTGAFGDGAEERRVQEWGRYGKAYAMRLPTPLLAWYSGQLTGEDSASLSLLMAPRPAAGPAELPPDTPDAIAIPSIGWAAMHSDLADRARVSVYFKSSPYGSFGHSHADQNSFVIHAHGRALAIDSGYYDYFNSTHWNRWYTQTLAHNAITYDGGKGQTSNTYSSGRVAENKAAAGRIARFEHRHDHDVVIGNATAAYGGALSKALRAVVYFRPGTIVIIDSLSSKTQRQWEWNIHALEKLEVSADHRLELRNGDTGLCVDMFGSQPLQFRQTDAFTAAPEGKERPRQWHGAYTSGGRTTEMQFVAVMSVNCAAIPNLDVKQGRANEWTVTVGARTVRYLNDELIVK